MSGKLDQSLDEILSSRRQTARRGGRGGRRSAHPAKPTVVAPVGGVKKHVKPARGAVRAAVPSGPAAGSGDSKIIVSNLVSNNTPPASSTIAYALSSSSLPMSARFKSRYVELEATIFWRFSARSRLIVDCCEPFRSSKG